MSVISTASEKTDLQQKRQDLFSLWSTPQAQADTPQTRQVTVHTLPAERLHKPVAMDEVERLIHRFADPNADRMFLK